MNTDHVLGLLLEKEQFNIARKYAELVNSTSSQISIKEVCNILKNVHSMIPDPSANKLYIEL